MSFVILKNNNQQAANAFSNQFTDTLTIPRNSEVGIALDVSQPFATICRPRLVLQGYIYHGPELDEDGDPVNGGPESVQQPTEIHLTNGAYTVDELAAHIQTKNIIQIH
eukprot:SAG11_NODE_25436_length_357_cov_2.204633_1_plen_108_part_01